jgi:hypothetical protein
VAARYPAAIETRPRQVDHGDTHAQDSTLLCGIHGIRIEENDGTVGHRHDETRAPEHQQLSGPLPARVPPKMPSTVNSNPVQVMALGDQNRVRKGSPTPLTEDLRVRLCLTKEELARSLQHMGWPIIWKNARRVESSSSPSKNQPGAQLPLSDLSIPHGNAAFRAGRAGF